MGRTQRRAAGDPDRSRSSCDRDIEGRPSSPECPQCLGAGLVQGAGGAMIDHENRAVWIVAGTVPNALIGKVVFEDSANLVELAHDFRHFCPRSGISQGVQRRQSANFRSVPCSPDPGIERADHILDRLLKGG
ncbi:hypothetical protein ACFFX0_33250 [Citricoccus parietis]|uniref:Uncharacterized protein n=1 Tax=Citricoccus parietis TaxID=592307 RepID=A0ABV5G9X7_9MICC